MRPKGILTSVLLILLHSAVCNAATNFSELVHLGVRTWNTSAWGVIVEDDAKDDSLLEELTKAANKPALLTWAEAARLMTHKYNEEEEFTFFMESLVSLSRFMQFVGQALPRQFRFYMTYEYDKGISLPTLFMDSMIFMISYGENVTMIYEMFGNNIREDGSNVTDCQNEEDLITIQVACRGGPDILCDPMAEIWDRRSDFKAGLQHFTFKINSFSPSVCLGSLSKSCNILGKGTCTPHCWSSL